MKAAQQTKKSAELNLTAEKKGLGFRTDLNLSVDRTDSHIQRETPTSMDERITNYKNAETIQLQQKFPWGMDISLYSQRVQSDKDNEAFEELADDTVAYGASLQQEFLLPIEEKLDIDEADAFLSEKTAAVQSIERQVVLEVAEAYYNYARAAQTLAIRQKSYEIATALSELSEKLFQKGVSLDVGVLEAKLSKSIAQANLKNAELSTRQTLNNLLRAMGKPEAEPRICAEAHKCDYKGDLPVDLRDVLEEHPSLKELEYQAAQFKVGQERQKRNFHPSLVLDARYERIAYDSDIEKFYQDEANDREWSVGLIFSVPLWDNHLNKNRLDAIGYQIKSLYSTRSADLAILLNELENALKSIEELDLNIETLQGAVRLSEENLSLMNEKFVRGLNNVDDVIRAEQNLTSANLGLINSVIDYNIAVAKLAYLTGHYQWPAIKDRGRP